MLYNRNSVYSATLLFSSAKMFFIQRRLNEFQMNGKIMQRLFILFSTLFTLLSKKIFKLDSYDFTRSLFKYCLFYSLHFK